MMMILLIAWVWRSQQCKALQAFYTLASASSPGTARAHCAENKNLVDSNNFLFDQCISNNHRINVWTVILLVLWLDLTIHHSDTRLNDNSLYNSTMSTFRHGAEERFICRCDENVSKTWLILSSLTCVENCVYLMLVAVSSQMFF